MWTKNFKANFIVQAHKDQSVHHLTTEHNIHSVVSIILFQGIYIMKRAFDNKPKYINSTLTKDESLLLPFLTTPAVHELKSLIIHFLIDTHNDPLHNKKGASVSDLKVKFPLIGNELLLPLLNEMVKQLVLECNMVDISQYHYKIRLSYLKQNPDERPPVLERDRPIKASNFERMLDEGDYASLSRIHEICNVPENRNHSVMAAKFADHVEKQGMAITKEWMRSDRSNSFVEALLQFFTDSEKILNDNFPDSVLMKSSLSTSLKKTASTKIGLIDNESLICDYIDKKLRAGDVLNSDSVNVVTFSCHLKDLNFFKKLYEERLAARLLSRSRPKSTSLVSEKSIIFELKKKHGENFTRIMDGMIDDVLDFASNPDYDFSKKNHLEYVEKTKKTVIVNTTTMTTTTTIIGRSSTTSTCSKTQTSTTFSEDPKLELDVMLIGSHWPAITKQYSDLILPAEMQKSIDSFAKFHKNVKVSRKISWHHGVGSSVVDATYCGKTYELLVTTLQAVAFMLFQDGVELR